MRIFAVSDTHRYRHELLTAVKNAQPFSAILHAGDETSDAEWLVSRVNWPVYAVAGNWDSQSQMYPSEQIFDFGVQILLIHGHRQRVKENLTLLASKARESKANIVIYGHSHIARTTMLDNVLYVNPGSIAAPRGRRERTYAMIDIDETSEAFLVRVSHCLITGQTVAGLHETVEFRKSDN